MIVQVQVQVMAKVKDQAKAKAKQNARLSEIEIEIDRVAAPVDVTATRSSQLHHATCDGNPSKSQIKSSLVAVVISDYCLSIKAY